MRTITTSTGTPVDTDGDVLAIIETIVRKQEEKGLAAFNPIPYVALGAAAIGLMMLAGHPELIYYTMLVSGGFAAVRLVAAWRRLAAAQKSP